MKKLLISLIVLGVGAWMYNVHQSRKAEVEAKRRQAAQEEQEIRNEVAATATQLNALTGWEEQLTGQEGIRLKPVLTVELERVWLRDRPILFQGVIKDVATLDEHHYSLLLERGAIHRLDHYFVTDLRLSLVAQKELVDTLLESHQDLVQEFGFSNGVAAVALIESIRTEHYLGEEGGREEIKIGEGRLVSLVYTGSVRL